MRLAALTLLAATSALAKDKLVVMPLAADPLLAALSKAATEQLATDLSKDGRFDVIGHTDLETLLGVERQKQLLGCSDDSAECMSELSGALGAPYLLSGVMTQTADGVRVDLKLLQTEQARVLAREGALAQTEAELLPMVSHLVSQLLLQLPGARASQLKQRLPLFLAGGAAAGAVAGLLVAAAQGVQTGSLQARLSGGTIDAVAAAQARKQVYDERWAAGLLIALGTAAAVGCLLWWWLQ